MLAQIAMDPHFRIGEAADMTPRVGPGAGRSGPGGRLPKANQILGAFKADLMALLHMVRPASASMSSSMTILSVTRVAGRAGSARACLPGREGCSSRGQCGWRACALLFMPLRPSFPPTFPPECWSGIDSGRCPGSLL